MVNTGTQAITQLSFTIKDTMVGNIFWDSDGSGDAGTPKPFTVNSAGGTGVTNANGVTVTPLPGGGYSTLVIDFPNFDPGETVKFSIDVDPRSAAGFGSGSPHGAISGLEMSGTLVGATFADGTTGAGTLFGTGGNDARAVVGGDTADAVSLALAGIGNGQSGTVISTSQTLLLDGPANATVRVLVGNGDVLPDDASGVNLLPKFGVNSIEGLTILTTTLDASGKGSLTVDLSGQDAADPNDGVFRIMAAVLDGNGNPSGFTKAPVSVIVEGGVTPPDGDLIAAFNVGGPAYASVDDNVAFAADPGVSSGTATVKKVVHEVGGTQDDPLYQTYATGNFGYSIAVPEVGVYQVDLYLTETFQTAVNKRVFDVALEGLVPTAFDDIDIFEQTGGQWQALKLSQTVSVIDGTLNIDFGASINNAIVSAIAVSARPDLPPPPSVTGDTATVLEDGTVLIDVLANDAESVSLTAVGSPSDGSVAIEDGRIRYTPNADFSGGDSFTYQVTGVGGVTATAEVSVLVNPVNDAPSNVSLVGTTVAETAAPGTVVGQVSAFDPDGDALTFTVSDSRFAVNATGQLVVAAGANLAGDGNRPVPLSVTATDGSGAEGHGGLHPHHSRGATAHRTHPGGQCGRTWLHFRRGRHRLRGRPGRLGRHRGL